MDEPPRTHPAEDYIGKFLDWAGLAIGLCVLGTLLKLTLG
jgi:hypothetical protein